MMHLYKYVQIFLKMFFHMKILYSNYSNSLSVYCLLKLYTVCIRTGR